MSAGLTPALALRGRKFRMEALSVSHAEGLLRAGDEATFDCMPARPKTWDPAGMRAYIEALIARERHLALALIDHATGDAVGTSSYADRA